MTLTQSKLGKSIAPVCYLALIEENLIDKNMKHETEDRKL